MTKRPERTRAKSRSALKTLHGTKDAAGKAEHVLSAFCTALEQLVGHTSSRGKGWNPRCAEIAGKIDVDGAVVTRDAIFCQKTIVAGIVEKGGNHLLLVKENQKDLRQEIETAFQ